MKKRLISGLILLALTLVLSVGAAFAALYTTQGSTDAQITLPATQSHNVYNVSSADRLFGIAFNEKYNDYAAVTDTQIIEYDGQTGLPMNTSNRIVIRLQEDITLNYDLVINRDVNIDLNGHTLDFNGHSLTVRHAYYGQFALYSSSGTGRLENSDVQRPSALRIQTPFADIFVDEIAAEGEGTVELSDVSVDRDNALSAVALECIKKVFASGGAGMYYLDRQDLPFVYRYGIHELDVTYYVDSGTGDVTATVGGQSAVVARVVQDKMQAAEYWLDDYMAQYLSENSEGGQEYLIYRPISLPVENAYLGLGLSYSADNASVSVQGGIISPATSAQTTQIAFNLQASASDGGAVSALASYAIVARDDSFRTGLATDIITAMLSRYSGGEYVTARGIILTAIYMGGDMNSASSYAWSGEAGTYYQLATVPSQIDMSGLGYGDMTADELGLERIEYNFADGDPVQVYAFDAGTATVGFYRDGITVLENPEIFGQLQFITARLEVTLTIGGTAMPAIDVTIGFSWSAEETITGEAGNGSPSNRFGVYFEQLEAEIGEATNNLYYNDGFTMRSGFNGYPYVAYRLQRINSDGTPYTGASSGEVLTVQLSSGNTLKSYSFPDLDNTASPSRYQPSGITASDLASPDARYVFSVNHGNIPLYGARYRIYVHHTFGVQNGWEQGENNYFDLFIPGIVQAGVAYDAQGNIAAAGTSGATVYFDAYDVQLYRYIWRKLYPDLAALEEAELSDGEKYIQTADVGAALQLNLYTSVNFDGYDAKDNPDGIQPPYQGDYPNAYPVHRADALNTAELMAKEITNFNWLKLFTGITVLDLTGRHFGDEHLALLTGLTSIKELYIGGYADDINMELTDISEMQPSSTLEVLDISYSYVSLFDSVTVTNYPSLTHFYCGGIVITRTINIIIFSFDIVDWRYGSNGTQNEDTLNDLVTGGVSVNNGGAFGQISNEELALSQIITQENVLVNSEELSPTYAIPALYYYVGGVKTSLESFSDYLDSRIAANGTLALYYSDNGVETTIGDAYAPDTSDPVGSAFASLIESVDSIIAQFPNDNSAIVADNGEGGLAAPSYGFKKRSTQKVVESGWLGRPEERLVSYNPLIGMNLDRIAYGEDGMMEAVSIRITYHTAQQRLDENGNAEVDAILTINQASYSVQHELGIKYGNSGDAEDSGYQDIVSKFTALASDYLNDYDYEFGIGSFDGKDWVETNASLNNLSQIMFILWMFERDDYVVDNLYSMLGNGEDGKCDHELTNPDTATPADKFELLTQHFNEWYEGLADLTAEKFKLTQEYQAVFGKDGNGGYIRQTRNNMVVYFYDVIFGRDTFISKIGFWFCGKSTLSSDNYTSAQSYELTDKGIYLSNLLTNFNSLNDSVKFVLHEDSHKGNGTPNEREYNTNGSSISGGNVPSEMQGILLSTAGWLSLLSQEVKGIAVNHLYRAYLGVQTERGSILGSDIVSDFPQAEFASNEFGQISVLGQQGMLTVGQLNGIVFGTYTDVQIAALQTEIDATLAALNSTEISALGGNAEGSAYSILLLYATA